MIDHPGVVHLDSLDHLVLTVKDIDATIAFYTRSFGMTSVSFAQGRKALAFGVQKINLHQQGSEFVPKARHPTPGSADLCFLSTVPLDEIVAHLKRCGVDIVEGPVRRTGAQGPSLSVYVRDPDMNLIEVANRVAE